VPIEVTTSQFEGPFDVLLRLIVEERIDLYEINLTEIVDAYLVELARLEGEGALDLETATSFLLIAATLIELKSRRLLPVPEDDDLDEELWLWEARDLLLARLIECKTFKSVAEHFVALAGRAQLSVPRRAGLEERFWDLAPDLLAGVTADRLALAAVRALTPKPEPKVSLEHVTPLTASVTDAVEELLRVLPRRRRATFWELTGHLQEKVEIVVRFLGVLELYKQGLVDLQQHETFGELVVVWAGDDHTDGALVLSGADSYDG
jgi:segregation and condensation protein A